MALWLLFLLLQVSPVHTDAAFTATGLKPGNNYYFYVMGRQVAHSSFGCKEAQDRTFFIRIVLQYLGILMVSLIRCIRHTLCPTV